ncbi:4-galactosyl-N-acetylglucosaminide 3-alpha-L-fucosyltransferase FUT5-like [Branchiostoma floridae]|uniref:Fucosyltransferase n=1 Tax=Branchiostoma floridae TaxID=7739 RepID=A0A9J7MAJ1_BRAFL|nr:4-galactosyl-N-acetylglucosaminide 3-alpha-L-fucosyltransferase FUT5-like [Branchiostoma floridae]
MKMVAHKAIIMVILSAFVISAVILYEQMSDQQLQMPRLSPLFQLEASKTHDNCLSTNQCQGTKRGLPSQFYKTWRDNTPFASNDKIHIKKIVLWTTIFGKNLLERMSCKSTKTCIFTDDRSQVESADAVVFHFWDTPMVYNKSFMPSVRPPHQFWVWYAKECPENNRYVDLASYSGIYNWTMTYRNDSDVKIPLGSLDRLYKQLQRTTLKRNSTGKTGLVTWFVSKCYKYFPRHIYAIELAKHLTIDVYGKCGKQVCEYLDMQCRFDVIQQYKFYLAFESYRCKEYITEKFWHNALDQGVVPIVLGAPKTDYEKFAPPNSFIHVEDFESPEALARYIKLLDKDDDKYSQYLKWRTNPPKNIPQIITGGCGICARLHEVDHTERKVYTDLEKWWKGENYEFCKPLVLTDNIWNKKDFVYYG